MGRRRMKFRIVAVAWLSLFAVLPAWSDPSNPYQLTNPGAFHEFSILPKGLSYRDEVVERVKLSGGRSQIRSRYSDEAGITESVYEMTSQGDLLRQSGKGPRGLTRFEPPVLTLPNLDKKKSWQSNSKATLYSRNYPEGQLLTAATRSGHVVGIEHIGVPAGNFMCIKVETEIVGLKCTEWYATGVGLVKMKAGSETYILQSYGTGHEPDEPRP